MMTLQLRPLTTKHIVRCRKVFLVIVCFCVAGVMFFLGMDVHPHLPLCAIEGAFCSKPKKIVQPVLEPIKDNQEEVRCVLGDFVYGKYCAHSPYFYILNNSASDIVTLCTQTTVEYVRHVAVQCGRWQGPMSVAVYAPTEDYPLASRLVTVLRRCDACVRRWVDWHFFFEVGHPPEASDDPPEERSCHVDAPKKRRSLGTYPINVGRNIARQRSETPFVLSVDVELYPSEGALPRFSRMMEGLQTEPGRNEVWVLPVFEVYKKYEAPTNKSKLKEMYDKKQAISFHRFRCNACHRIPNITHWFQYQAPIESEGSLTVWKTVKRNQKFQMSSWEPFFIGTQRDPLFDIELTWEGKQNKMQMAYEMCLRNYDFHILDEAFLVHAPGVNVYNATKERERNKYIRSNMKIMNIVRSELKKQYKDVKGC